MSTDPPVIVRAGTTVVPETLLAVPFAVSFARPPLIEIVPLDSLSAISAPAFTDVPPVYVLAPVMVNVPVPVLTTPPLPLITPANVVDVLSPPVVRFPVPSSTLLPATPVSEPTTWLLSLRSNVAPLVPSVTGVAAGRYCVPPPGTTLLLN